MQNKQTDTSFLLCNHAKNVSVFAKIIFCRYSIQMKNTVICFIKIPGQYFLTAREFLCGNME